MEYESKIWWFLGLLLSISGLLHMNEHMATGAFICIATSRVLASIKAGK